MNKLLLLFILTLSLAEYHAQNGGTWTWIHGDTVAGTSSFGTKGVSSPSNLPPGRYHPAYWQDLNGNFWIFSGTNGLADMWMFNPNINEWTWVSGSNLISGKGGVSGSKGVPSKNNYPSERVYGAACWTDSIGDLWLYGGSSRNDLWRYNILNNEWTWMDGDANTTSLSTSRNHGTLGIPSSSNFPGMRWECKSNWVVNNELVFFGGGCTGGNCNDVWTYSISSNVWTWIGGNNTSGGTAVKGTLGIPSSSNRAPAGWTYTKWKKDDKLYIYSIGGSTNDIYSFDMNSKMFTWESGSAVNLPPSNCLSISGYYPQGRHEYHTVQTEKCNNSFWVFSGGSYCDLWLYRVDSNYWLKVSQNSNLNCKAIFGSKGVANIINHPQRKTGMAIWSDKNSNLYVYGGASANGNISDLWKFEPDPICVPLKFLQGNALSRPKKKTICFPNDSVVMNLDTSFYNITWSPSVNTSTNADTSIIIFKPKSNTSYIVTAQGGTCTAFDTLYFDIKIGTPTYDTIYDTVCSGTKWSQFDSSGIYDLIYTNSTGCDSNLHLHLTKYRYDTSIYIYTCTTSPYIYNGTTYTTSGTYIKTLTSSNGCDSNIKLNLTLNAKSPLKTIKEKICEGDTFKYNGYNYTTDIIVTHMLTNKFGCDSPVKLDLKFLPTYTYHVYDTFCAGDSFKFSNNQFYKTAGDYNFTYQNEYGCDSIVNLHLVQVGAGNDTITIDSIVFGNMCDHFNKKIIIYPININSLSKFSLDWGISYQPQSIFNNLKAGTYNIRIKKKCAYKDTVVVLPYRERDTTLLSAELCQGQAFLFNNVVRSTTGIYWDTFANKYGCDSFLQLDLKIWENDTTHVYDSICDGSSIDFDFQTLTAAGDYSSITQSSHFCDSTTILHLFVHSKPSEVFNVNICDQDSFTIWDTVYKTSGSIMHLDTSRHGCDSTTWYNLFVAPVYNSTLDRTICKGDTFVYFGQKFFTNGIHTIAKKTAIYNCDSIMKITLTVNKIDTSYRYDTISSGDTLKYLSFKYTKAGIYKHKFKNELNCDSTLYLNITVLKRDSTFLNFQKCIGDSLVYLDSTWRLSGNYRYNLKNKMQVDSFIFINLVIKNQINSVVTKSICRGQSFLGHTIAGIFIDTFKRPILCDSIRELRLSVFDSTSYSYSKSVCKLEPYFFNGVNRYAPGIFRDTLINSNLCDSFVYLTLTVGPPIRTQIYPVICSGQQFKKFKTAGIYYDTIITAIGCDSIEEINLTVLAKPYSTSQNFEACNYVEFKNKFYFKSDTIRDTIFNYLNCDSVYRTTYILIRPAPKVKYPRNFVFCDSFFIGKMKYTFSFNYTDTIKTKDSLHCDSTYQRTAYILKKTAPMHIVAFPNLPEYIIGEPLVLETNYARNLFWSTGEQTQKINVVLYNDKSYQVIGWNDEECKDTAYIDLRAVPPAILDIPKAFAPFGINENRTFKPNYNGKVTLIQFVIFNRWGEKIFSAKDINLGWDGTYKNEFQPAGVYTYLLEYKMNRNVYFKSGEVLLVR